MGIKKNYINDWIRIFILFGIKKGTCSFSKGTTSFFFKEQGTKQIPFYKELSKHYNVVFIT